MGWETLWALVLGFTLSGAVQAFVTPDQMRDRLGDRRPRTIVRAAVYGMVSSSCSYAASAMSKSLFARGADFTTSMVFMIASTNLVVELGVVLLVLIGWQFAAAEFVGGPLMIALLALVGGWAFGTPLVSAARTRLAALTDDVAPDATGPSPERNVRRLDGWSNAASYAVADATMLRRELLLGYLVAGGLAVMVPASWWSAVFVRGHGPWTSLENALVGPLIAVVSWVCSVGNVPLAAALWHGGISFGGVIAFIFADLIATPLLLIYRKFYGARLSARVALTFYGVMVVAGLITEVLFRATGLVPRSRQLNVVATGVHWNYTAWLNVLALLVAGVVWALARRRRHQGTASGYAIDPVCGMQVRVADAPARLTRDGRSYYFCADRCRDRFVAGGTDDRSSDDPIVETIAPLLVTLRSKSPSDAAEDTPEEFIDPICGMSVSAASAAAHRRVDDRDVWFCATQCALEFDRQQRPR